jgi:aldose 1-epimerase
VIPPEPLKLEAFGQTVVLWPEVGGRIAAWRTAGGWDGLAPIPLDLPVADALRQGGCYPLAPYCNRIEAARFAWEGRTIQLRADPISHPHSLHGCAWRRAFAVERQGEGQAVLVLDRPADADWPWAFRLEQTVRLSQAGLEIELTLRNTDPAPQPIGLGFHPFFPYRDKARLRFRATGRWALAPDKLPQRLAPIPADRDFSAGAAAPTSGADDLYAGFDGAAAITWPSLHRALRLEASPGLDHVVLFTPASGRAFAFEPVGHATNAHNQAGMPGLTILAPGEALSAALRLSPEPLCGGED